MKLSKLLPTVVLVLLTLTVFSQTTDPYQFIRNRILESREERDSLHTVIENLKKENKELIGIRNEAKAENDLLKEKVKELEDTEEWLYTYIEGLKKKQRQDESKIIFWKNRLQQSELLRQKDQDLIAKMQKSIALLVSMVEEMEAEMNRKISIYRQELQRSSFELYAEGKSGRELRLNNSIEIPGRRIREIYLKMRADVSNENVPDLLMEVYHFLSPTQKRIIIGADRPIVLKVDREGVINQTITYKYKDYKGDLSVRVFYESNEEYIEVIDHPFRVK